MSDLTYHFRSALGGYHKGDVLGFIEKVAAEHRSEILDHKKIIADLREENRSLQQQLNLLMISTPIAAPVEPEPEPEPEIEPEPIAEPVPEPAKEQDPADMSAAELVNMELQAYRRAEAMERSTNKRAMRLYQQLEEVCTDTRGQFDGVGDAVKQTIASMLEQTKALEQSYQQLYDALEASREKIAVMNSLICDEDETED